MTKSASTENASDGPDEDSPEVVGLEADEFDVLERLIAGNLKAETIVGDGAFAKLAFGTLRDRVRPKSLLAEIDKRVTRRIKGEQGF